MEATAFDEVTETFDSSEDGEKLTVVSTVLGLRLGELAGEEGERLSGVVNKLLQDSASPSVGDICCNGNLRVLGREGQLDSVAEGLLSCEESGVCVRSPDESDRLAALARLQHGVERL